MLTLANGYRVAVRPSSYFGSPCWRVVWDAPVCNRRGPCRCGSATHYSHAEAIETVCEIAARPTGRHAHAPR